MISTMFQRKRKRYNTLGHGHLLTFSCYRRQPLLSKEHTCRYLAEGLEGARRKHRFDLWAYVFMPEHVHLLLWPRPQEYSISSILQTVKQSVSRRVVLELRKHDPERLSSLATGQTNRPYRFWQDGGGHDRNVVSGSTAKAAIDYIHGNPVRRGLVADPTDWHWSSAADWLKGLKGPIPLDRNSVPAP